MKIVQDFFMGKTEWVKTALLAEINASIETQNFEWAAKLRDIYKNLDQFTQKQTVVVDSVLDGVVVKIVSIETKRVYVIMVFQKGKMVDVLRFGELQDELDMDQIIQSIEIEFGKVKVKVSSFQLPVTSWSILYSEKMKISNKAWKEMDMHLDRFISSFIASSSRQKDSVANDCLKWLQTRYWLQSYPYRIECLDISHLSGWWASGGLSCMVGSIYNKKWYRKYKIKIAKWGDDYNSLKEVIVRKFKKTTSYQLPDTSWDKVMEAGSGELVAGSWYLPDLFIIDGGPKQLDVVVKLLKDGTLDPALSDYIQFASLGKGDARKSKSKIYGEKEKLYVLSKKQVTRNKEQEDGEGENSFEFWVLEYELKYDEVDKLLVRIRDEAHRFANSYRKKQMSMEIKG